ncbi:hypothetical protein GCM10025781_08170 [Kocuria gwangalliensis]|uniref:N-acetyltransferase domain-containing protein n=1 Tax=Kocuria gwangalliensis TaxID=501592 RepID=A0ABP8WPT8_9MICC
MWYIRLPPPEGMRAEIATRLVRHADQLVIPWIIRRRSDGRTVGMTTFLNLRLDHRRLEIGSTWLAASAQGTGLNTEVKLQQLTWASKASITA